MSRINKHNIKYCDQIWWSHLFTWRYQKLNTNLINNPSDTHSKLVLSVQIAHITEASFKICMKQVDTNQLNKVKQIVSIQLCYKYWASFSNLFTLKIHIGISPPPRHHLMYRPMHRPMHGPACQPKPQSCPTKTHTHLYYTILLLSLKGAWWIRPVVHATNFKAVRSCP